MKKYRCLIVEDEPLAAEVLRDYISQMRQLELVGICEDAIYAMETLRKENIDLIFLDIHLPKLKGLDFIKALTNPPQIIITTAYHQYALEGFELSVIDYLMKPIEFSRFLQAINKLKPLHKEGIKKSLSLKKDRAFRFFNVKKKKVKLYLDEIQYIESRKDYVKIHTEDQCLTTKFQLGELEGILEEAKLLRIHRSFLVSRAHIRAFSATEIEVADQKLPIGRSYKEQVFKALGEE